MFLFVNSFKSLKKNFNVRNFGVNYVKHLFMSRNSLSISKKSFSSYGGFINPNISENNKLILKRLVKQLEITKLNNFKVSDMQNFVNEVCESSREISDNSELREEIANKFKSLNFAVNLLQILSSASASNQLDNLFDKIFPKFIKTIYFLKIGDKALWDQIEDVYFKNIENLHLSSHLEILNYTIDNFKTHFKEDADRAERFKKGFLDFMFAFETQDYLNLSLKQIMFFLAIFADSFNKNHNDLLYQIQQILIDSHLKKLLSKENDVELFCITIFKLMINPEVSIDFLMEKLLDEAVGNVLWINFKSQLFLLSSYRLFLDRHRYTPNSQFHIKTKKMAKLIDGDLSLSNLHKLQLTEVIEVLITFAYLEEGSNDFFLEIDKIVGKHISEIDPNYYLAILDAFVKTRNQREKFITLMQNKVYANREKIRLGDLCKIMRIFATLKLSNETIFEKMQNYILGNKHSLDDYEISDFVFAYSNLKTPQNFVLTDMEDIIDHKSVKWAEKKKLDIIIDILNSYLIAKKGEKEFIEKLKIMILNLTKNIKNYEIDDYSVFKMYHIFYLMKLPYEDIKLFDNLLKSKLKYYSNDEYKALNKFLTEIEYKNEKTLEIIRELERIGEDYKEKAAYFQKMNLL